MFSPLKPCPFNAPVLTWLAGVEGELDGGTVQERQQLHLEVHGEGECGTLHPPLGLLPPSGAAPGRVTQPLPSQQRNAHHMKGGQNKREPDRTQNQKQNGLEPQSERPWE